MFKVTRLFLNGNLSGLEFTDVTKVEFQVGKIYKPCAGAGDYKITACVKI